MQNPNIHPTAIIDPNARIASGCSIGPYCVIGPEVQIAENCYLASHVVIEGRTTIGTGNKIFQFASVGSIPQDLKYSGETSTLQIGNNNIIREYVTLQPGTKGGGMKTVIGNCNLFMACTHVGHDSFVGNENVFANSAAIAGHVIIGNKVIVGGLSGIHQFVRVGDLALLGGGSMVVKDIPPFCIAQGDRAELVGLNKIGLERAGYSQKGYADLKKLYRELFFEQGSFKVRLARLRDALNDQNIAKKEVAGAADISNELALQLVNFIYQTQRGVTLPRTKSLNNLNDVLSAEDNDT